jgi:hypothetical protein
VSKIACPKCRSADHVFITSMGRGPPFVFWTCRDAACDPKPFTNFSPEALAQAEKFAKRQAELSEIDRRHPDGARPDGHHFDKQGAPISMNDWIRRVEDYGYKVVARSNLPGGGFVSTVWLGLDHGFGGRRLIFESMVFETGDEERDGDTDRYSTLDEAQAGHLAMVRKHGGGQ